MITPDTGKLTKEQKKQLKLKWNALGEKWKDCQDDETWHEIFDMVLDCCNHIMSQKAPWREDREDLAMDAAIRLLERIKNGYQRKVGDFWPESLPTYCRFEVINQLYNDKRKNEDDMASFDALVDAGMENGFTKIF